MPQFATSSNSTTRMVGFTLVEVLIIAPLVILLIGVAVSYITNLTGESLKTKERTTLSGETQSALNVIENSALLATKFAKTTTAIPDPAQDANDTTTSAPIVNFQAKNGNDGVLIIKKPATTAISSSSSRDVVLTPGPSTGCFDPAVNRTAYSVTEVFFIKNSTLWKRTIRENYGNYCSEPYQLGSCAQGVSNTTYCKAEDEKIAENVSDLSVTYTTSGGTTTPADSMTDAAIYSTVAISLTTSKQVAGENITSTMKLTVKSKNI